MNLSILSKKRSRSKILILDWRSSPPFRNRAPIGRIVEQGNVHKITRNMDYMQDTGKY